MGRNGTMSGGYFEYKQFNIDTIVYELDEYINGRELDEDEINEIVNSPYFYCEKDYKNYVKEHHRTPANKYGYSKETIDKFKRGLKILKQAAVYTQRIDWLLSGDNSEESFHRRLKEDLEKIE